MLMPTAVTYICAAMLFMGAAPLPYGYSILLRLVACGVFAFAMFIAFEKKHKSLPWVYGLLALLFNPLIKVYLPKDVWVVVDVAAAILLLATAKPLKLNA